jgi:hypothetical protein
MDRPKKNARVRYRQLALAEPDKDKPAVLYIADEAERDVLCTVDRNLRRQPNRSRGDANFSRWSERSSCAC